MANKLFHKNNIYRLLSTPRECTIDIIPSKKSYKNDFINVDYIEVIRDDEMISTSQDSIPPPPPSSITPIVPLPPPRNLPPLNITSDISANSDIRNIFRRLREHQN